MCSTQAKLLICCLCLLQIPADMLLMHIFIPFTVEHVRVKGAVKAAVQTWLQLVARCVISHCGMW